MDSASSAEGMKRFAARLALYLFLSVNGFLVGAAFMSVKRGDLVTIVVGSVELGAVELVRIGALGVLFMPFILTILTVQEQ